MLVAMVVASLAALSADSLPEMAGWPRIQKMEDSMEEVRGFDVMRASHNDLLSVQKIIVFER